MPAHKPSEPNPDYVQCPYCKRRFQESAAERHIPFCKEQNSRLEHNPASVKAKQSLSKRMQVSGMIQIHIVSGLNQQSLMSSLCAWLIF